MLTAVYNPRLSLFCLAPTPHIYVIREWKSMFATGEQLKTLNAKLTTLQNQRLLLGPTPPLFSLIDEPVGWKFVEISWVAQVTWRNFLLSFAGNFALLTFLIPWLGKLSSRSSCWYSSCNCVLFALVWGDMSEISLEIFSWFIEISRVSCYFRSASDAGITPTVSSALQRKKENRSCERLHGSDEQFPPYFLVTSHALLIRFFGPPRRNLCSVNQVAVLSSFHSLWHHGDLKFRKSKCFQFLRDKGLANFTSLAQSTLASFPSAHFLFECKNCTQLPNCTWIMFNSGTHHRLGWLVFIIIQSSVRLGSWFIQQVSFFVAAFRCFL